MQQFSEFSNQRWLALGLLLLVLTLVSGFILVPLINQAIELTEEKNELLFRFQRYQKIIARKDDVLANFTKIKSDYQDHGYFNQQTTEALASADLQKAIKNAINSAGGQLTSTQVLPSKTEDQFTRIAVKVRMTGDIEVLRSVLHHIETSVPLYIIDQLDIRPERGRRNRKTRMIEPSNKLNVSFEAVSFMSGLVS